MKTYRTRTSITINSGEIALSEKQASARSHLLIPQGAGVYLPKADLHFKAGEVIGLEVVDKSLAQSLELMKSAAILNRDIPKSGKGSKK